MTDQAMLTKATRRVMAVLAFVVPVLAMAWVLAVPQRMGLMVFPEQMAGLMLCLALAVSFLATLPPAWRASRLDPVEALRYE